MLIKLKAFTLTSITAASSSSLVLGAAIGGVIGFCALLLLVVIVFRRRRHFRTNYTSGDNAGVQSLFPKTEVHSGHVHLVQQIGVGTIGTIYLAEYSVGPFGVIMKWKCRGVYTFLIDFCCFQKPQNKMLQVSAEVSPRTASDEEVKKWLAGIDLLTRIEFHQNIIKFIGQVTVAVPWMLIQEYCANGNLRDYLRKVHINRIISPCSHLSI